MSKPQPFTARIDKPAASSRHPATHSTPPSGYRENGSAEQQLGSWPGNDPDWASGTGNCQHGASHKPSGRPQKDWVRSMHWMHADKAPGAQQNGLSDP